MNSHHRRVDAIEGIRQLAAELSSTDHKSESKGIIFSLHSGKRIQLLDPSSDPPGSVLVRRYNDFTLGYTSEIPYGDPAQDNQLEVVRDHNDRLYFRENGELLTPGELAAKLVGLVTRRAESA